MLDPSLVEKLLVFQRNEITEHHVYRGLARLAKGQNAAVLERLAEEELGHYRSLASYTHQEVNPRRWRIFLYRLAARVFGLTFAIKLMEAGERGAEGAYAEVAGKIPELEKIMADETGHEASLVELIDEERLGYLSSMVLGVNDALVELTGALAGFTFALQSSSLVGLSGLITGVAASLSMAASEYLSAKSERGPKAPLRAALYTGIAYVFTVVLLVFPFFLFSSPYAALGLALADALVVIAAFTFFMAVVRDLRYRRTLVEMVAISMGVALVSFLIGWLLRTALGIEA
ncbi:MAG: VIT1/CCC1 transporter family protein [Candidatus Bipolaricaulis sp.]|nr:VIT1/CCC1 transporter family protein [Candidatus Bipolaricaulis sp.]